MDRRAESLVCGKRPDENQVDATVIQLAQRGIETRGDGRQVCYGAELHHINAGACRIQPFPIFGCAHDGDAAPHPMRPRACTFQASHSLRTGVRLMRWFRTWKFSASISRSSVR